MCLPLVAVGLMLAGTAMAAKAQNDSGKYNAKVQEENAKIQEWKANDDIAQGEEQALRIRQKTVQAIGFQRAQMAANGGVVDVGSNAIIQSNTEYAGAEDMRTTRANARRAAFGDEVGAMNSSAQGALDAYQGKSGAVSTVLTGAGSAASGYMNMMGPSKV